MEPFWISKEQTTQIVSNLQYGLLLLVAIWQENQQRALFWPSGETGK